MKSTIKHIIGIVGAVVLAGSSVSCDRYDYPDRFRATEGLPTIDYVRYADRDVFIDQAFMDEILCIVGTNLTSVHDIYFNDQKAIINTSYITDKTLVVSVPSTQASEVPLSTCRFSLPLKSTALWTVTTLSGDIPYLLMTMFLVRSLTAITLSAASMPLFSMPYTLESIISSVPRS